MKHTLRLLTPGLGLEAPYGYKNRRCFLSPFHFESTPKHKYRPTVTARPAIRYYYSQPTLVLRISNLLKNNINCSSHPSASIGHLDHPSSNVGNSGTFPQHPLHRAMDRSFYYLFPLQVQVSPPRLRLSLINTEQGW